MLSKTKEQLYNYIMKLPPWNEKGEEILYQYGLENLKEPNQGKRTDLEIIELMINQGASPQDIFNTSIRYRKYEHMIISAFAAKRQAELPPEREVNCTWHFGNGRTGKSHTYIDLCNEYGRNNVYFLTDFQSGGMDSYLISGAPITAPKGKKQLFAKTLGELAEKVYLHERNKNKRGKRTFEEVFEELIAERLRRTKKKEKLLSKQNTINKWRQDLKHFYEGTTFINMYVDEITVNHLEDVAEYNLNRYDLNKKAFENMLTIPRMVLRFAFTKYYTNENVYLRLDRKQFADMVVDTVPIEERAYSDDELLMILDAVHEYQHNKPDYIVPYALELQILTACRRGEIPPLMWSDVKGDDIIISKEQLTIRKTRECKQHCEIVHHTKNYKNRAFPITDDIEDLLKRLRAVHAKNQLNSVYLFPADTPTGVISNCVVYKLYDRITTQLGIKKEGVVTGPHSFRRNAITDVVNVTNGDLELASRLYGNTPIVAKQNYLTGVDRKQALSALNARSISNRVLINH